MKEKDREEEQDTLWQETKQLVKRVPRASSAAFLMCFIGIIVFSACLFAATDYLVKLFDIRVVGQVVWLWMLLHVAAACVFLILATLATGDTRREVCEARCKHCNIIGKLAQISAMGSAYFLHFVWLLVIAILLLPVGMLTGMTVVCPMVPDCVNLTHYGIPPEYIDKIRPDDWINTMDRINSTDLIRYINQTEDIVQDAIVTVEGSPILDELLTKIEDNIPSDEEVQKFLDMLLQYVDAEPIVQMLSNLQGEVRKVDTDKVIDDIMVVVNDTLEELDKVTDALEDAVDEFSEEREKAFDALEKGINDTLGDGSSGAGERKRRSAEEEAHLHDMEVALGEKFEHVKDSLTIAGGNVLKALDDLYATKQIMHANLSVVYGEMDDIMAQKLSNIRRRSANAVYKIVHSPATPARTLSRRKRQEDELTDVDEQVDKAVDAVEDGLEKASDALDNVDTEEVAEKVEDALANAEEVAEEIVDKAVEEAEKLAKEAEKLAKQAAVEVEKLAKEAHELAKKGMEEGKRVAELTEVEIKRLVEDAKRMAQNADVAARIAAAEAELAIQRAEEATKNVLGSVDEEAARLAREGEEWARKAAKQAQIAADRALERAKQTAVEAERLVKAAAEGATATLLEAARNIRYYASVAIQAAKYATREAAKGARKFAKYYDVAKVEVKKGYAQAKVWWSKKLGVEKKGRDTFCLGAKIKFCNAIDSAHYNMIFVFIAAFVINKSMVHFLMAMSANWVHLRREEQEQDRQEQVDKADGAVEKLVYRQNEEGSVMMI